MHGAPVWDPFGRQKQEVGQENVRRYSNKGDLVSFFDNSAKKTNHPDALSYAPAFWHDYHTMDQGGGRLGGEVVGGEQEQTKTQFNPMSFEEPDDTKMAAMTEYLFSRLSNGSNYRTCRSGLISGFD